MVKKGDICILRLSADGNDACIPDNEFGKRCVVVEIGVHSSVRMEESELCWGVYEDMLEPCGGPW